jgi:hypothetical protein
VLVFVSYYETPATEEMEVIHGCVHTSQTCINGVKVGDISGFHGDEFGDGCFLGCCAVWSGRN